MMTREEAIAVLAESKRQNEVMRDNPSTFWASHQMADGVKNAERRIAALDMALSALRPVSRERVERMAGEWVQDINKGPAVFYCSSCGESFEIHSYEFQKYRFCPFCMSPMTDEAEEMVMERMEALHHE